FNYMKKYFHTKSGNKNWISCRLEKSFRSVPEILSFIDKIFGNLRKEISFIDNEIKHIPHRKNDQGYIEIWPLLPRYKEEEQQPLQINLTNRKHYIIPDRLLAQAIAHKIHTWLSKGRILVTKDRHMEPGDIMILIRQRNMLVDYLISELKKVSVPVIGRDSFRIMDYIVIQDLIALAEFLLLPTNDLALANVLKSPLFNFTEDDLFNISYNRKEQSLWERLQNYSFVIYSELDYLINLSHTESLLTLFTHVIYTGKKKFIARLGLECSEVLDEFINLVLQFENLSLQGFIQWIKENNPEIKNDMQTHYNAVRIMTIHKSKGLQSPIVFLADTNTIPKNNESIIFDAMEAPFWCERNTNVYCDQIKRKKKLEDYNEYLRLLYVALTRAEDELYILGKEPVQKGSWYDLIANNQELYEKKQSWLQPIFKEKVEISCVNVHYPFIYKQLDHFDIPVVSFPPNLTTLLQKAREKKNYWISTLSTWNNKQERIETNNYRKGLIIHNILQYMPKIEKNRRESWIK
ncbi:MAG: DNA helicase UvrD, partial [Wolbachia pipientis]|nr:DNA helicase UvrD [Wolbachia pipientis]